MARKFLRTVLYVEVITEDKPPDVDESQPASLGSLMSSSELVGAFHVKSTEEVAAKWVAGWMTGMDKDPRTFGLDALGNDLLPGDPEECPWCNERLSVLPRNRQCLKCGYIFERHRWWQISCDFRHAHTSPSCLMEVFPPG